MKILLALFAFLLLPAVANASGQCYTIYDESNKIVLRSENPPIDMSQSISSQMEVLYPGKYLVVSPNERSCDEIDISGRMSAGVGPGGSGVPWQNANDVPLLRRAAEASALLTSANDEDADASFYSSRSYSSGSSKRSAGSDVRVRAYQRSNGTSVKAYVRAAPGRGR